MPLRFAFLALLLTVFARPAHSQQPAFDSARAAWQPAEAPLLTRWADEVSPESVQDRPYPRPQMRRAQWMNLNGLWQYAFATSESEAPPFGETLDGEILVPFAVESALSGVGERTPDANRLWYRRTFEVPADWGGDRILLHFGAVDWDARVYVNGQEVGRHKGGYDPFTFDVTDALEESGAQELVVGVYDPTSSGTQPRGKQVNTPEGIWYTPVTGIWQTVWLEPVPPAGIQGMKMTPDVEAGALRLAVNGWTEDEGLRVEAVAQSRDGQEVGRAEGAMGDTLSVSVPDAQLWTPDTPYLYDLTVRLLQDGEAVDSVDSYFGMREVGLVQDEDGHARIALNGEPVFQYGPLDQGYWPGGLYTAPTDEALRYDLEVTKQLGFNMVRKHVKTEPARWYYYADSLGLLVWQDMPSGIAGPGPEVERTQADREQFEAELKQLIDDYYNHPSVILWVIFNEGWGQYDTERITRWAEAYDPSRLITNASGWTDRGVGDIRDIHAYPGPDAPPAETDRAIVLGEFGGLGLPMAGHTWQSEDNWGYESYEDTTALNAAYLDLVNQLHILVGEPGLSAAVYTQTTDVEVEVNGLMTYDRDILKMDSSRVAAANRRLYEEPPPEMVTLVPAADQDTSTWRYTTEAPADDWAASDFDDEGWDEGPGGFGSEDAPNVSSIGTPWTTSDLWARRVFSYEGEALSKPYLRIYHDDAATVYLNGERIADLDGWTSSYTLVPLDEAAQAALQEGRNVLAIHVRQDDGAQYLDAGLVDVRAPAGAQEEEGASSSGAN